jgi:hypothetical protein
VVTLLFSVTGTYDVQNAKYFFEKDAKYFLFAKRMQNIFDRRESGKNCLRLRREGKRKKKAS